MLRNFGHYVALFLYLVFFGGCAAINSNKVATSPTVQDLNSVFVTSNGRLISSVYLRVWNPDGKSVDIKPGDEINPMNPGQDATYYGITLLRSDGTLGDTEMLFESIQQDPGIYSCFVNKSNATCDNFGLQSPDTGEPVVYFAFVPITIK